MGLVPAACSLALNHTLKNPFLHVMLFLLSAIVSCFIFQEVFKYALLTILIFALLEKVLPWFLLNFILTPLATSTYSKDIENVMNNDFRDIGDFYDPLKRNFCLFIRDPQDPRRYLASTCLSAGQGIRSSHYSGRQLQGPHDAGIFRVGTLPSAQRLGLASRLVEYAEKLAFDELGVKRLWLETSNIQAAAMKLYERRGFVVSKRLPLKHGVVLLRYEKLAPECSL